MAKGKISLDTGDALLIVDVQNDFLPGGSLAVPHGDTIVPVLNDYIQHFTTRGLPVYASRDWHPPAHCSFIDQGGPWPAHCVAGTPGADFAPGLRLPPDAVVISKASAVDSDAYSAFQGTGLTQQLRDDGVQRLFVGGLATDYCVRHTVLDALDAGLTVFLLRDAIRAVDVHAGDGQRAEQEMLDQGAVPLELDALQ